MKIEIVDAFKAWWVDEGRSPTVIERYCSVLQRAASGTQVPSDVYFLSQAQRAFKRFQKASKVQTENEFVWAHERPPRWAVHAAFMLGNAIGGHVMSAVGRRDAESKGAVREFGSAKYHWPSSVAQLTWGQVSGVVEPGVATIRAPRGIGGEPMRDLHLRYWGEWLRRLAHYGDFDPDTYMSNNLPVFPLKPRSLIAFSRKETARLFMDEQQAGAKPFSSNERFVEIENALRPGERLYAERCAATRRDESTEPKEIRDAKYEIEKKHTFWK